MPLVYGELRKMATKRYMPRAPIGHTLQTTSAHPPRPTSSLWVKRRAVAEPCDFFGMAAQAIATSLWTMRGHRHRGQAGEERTRCHLMRRRW